MESASTTVPVPRNLVQEEPSGNSTTRDVADSLVNTLNIHSSENILEGREELLNAPATADSHQNLQDSIEGPAIEQGFTSALMSRLNLTNQLINGELNDISNSIDKLHIHGEQQCPEQLDNKINNDCRMSSSNGPNLPSPSTMTNTITDQETENSNISYISYDSELQMPSIMKLIQKDLSEPYSIYTYRYFIHNWPKLCFLAIDTSHSNAVVGAIVCKLDVHKQSNRRGYIAMLAVDEAYRRKKIGSSLVLRSIRAMAVEDADEIVLETEITNKSALRLYENLGFVRDKRLFRYYLNGVDALRLKLWLK